MTIKQYINKNGWQIHCKSQPCRAMTVDIDFVNSDGRDDETQFAINAYNSDELNDLYSAFCKENNFPTNTVTSITIVEMAETFEKLTL